MFECSLTSDNIRFITGVISRYNCRYSFFDDGIIQQRPSSPTTFEIRRSMKSTNHLTELVCRKASTPGKKLSDGQGMYLLVHKNGSKYWRMDFRLSGKRKTLALGVWPEVSLTRARKLREEAREQIHRGIDPLKHKRDQQRKRSASEERTFSVLCEEWMQRQKPRWTEKHAFDVRRALENHVLPDLGHLPIADIDRREVLSVLRVMEGQGKHEAAHRARQRMEAVFNFAIITGDCDANPAAGLTTALTPPRKKKMPALKPEELPEFLRRLEDYQGHRLTYLGMRLVIYTFVRTKELRLAEWKEFELKSENPVWTIPAERMKMRREHLVPLSSQSIQLLRQVSEISEGERLVFPSQNNPNRPMSENTLLYALYRMGYHSRATTHGFRSVASTILNESEKWYPDAIERQLAHVETNKVRAAYDRAEHLPERRRMMQWWSDYLDALKVSAQ